MPRFKKLSGGKSMTLYEVCSDGTLDANVGLSIKEIHTDPDFAPYYEWQEVSHSFSEYGDIPISIACHWDSKEVHYVVGPGGLDKEKLNSVKSESLKAGIKDTPEVNTGRSINGPLGRGDM